MDRTFMSRLKYFVWTIALIFQVSGVAFEAMMFVHLRSRTPSLASMRI